MEHTIRGQTNLLFLQVEEVDKYLFVDNIFTLSFWVLDLETNRPRVGDHWLVNVTISYDQPHLECNQGLIDVISCSGIDSTGYGKVQFKVRDISMNHGNKRFCLIFDGTNPITAQTLRGQTNPFVCVRHKLVIREENQTPYAWYKDEGGKDKCIEFQAILIDGNNTIVLGRVVPLRAVLMYYGGQPVLQQNILTVSPDSRAAIDETGIAKIKLRINEVSNRHRGQLFQVLVSPHFNDDVSPALSMPVEVRSKRNTTTKRDVTQVVTLPQLYNTPATVAVPGMPATYGSYGGYSVGGGEEYYDSNDSALKRARISYGDMSAAVTSSSVGPPMMGGGVPPVYGSADGKTCFCSVVMLCDLLLCFSFSMGPTWILPPGSLLNACCIFLLYDQWHHCGQCSASSPSRHHCHLLLLLHYDYSSSAHLPSLSGSGRADP